MASKPLSQRTANVADGSRLCENSEVGLARRTFVSNRLNKKRTSLSVSVESSKERKQFCAFSARRRFHTAWVKTGKPQCEQNSSALTPTTDITRRLDLPR